MSPDNAPPKRKGGKLRRCISDRPRGNAAPRVSKTAWRRGAAKCWVDNLLAKTQLSACQFDRIRFAGFIEVSKASSPSGLAVCRTSLAHRLNGTADIWPRSQRRKIGLKTKRSPRPRRAKRYSGMVAAARVPAPADGSQPAHSRTPSASRPTQADFTCLANISGIACHVAIPAGWTARRIAGRYSDRWRGEADELRAVCAGSPYWTTRWPPIVRRWISWRRLTMRIIVLFNLKDGISVADYEDTGRSTRDIPACERTWIGRQFFSDPSSATGRVRRRRSARPPFDYFEIIDIDRHGRRSSRISPPPEFQAAAAPFQRLCRQPAIHPYRGSMSAKDSRRFFRQNRRGHWLG